MMHTLYSIQCVTQQYYTPSYQSLITIMAAVMRKRAQLHGMVAL